MRIVFVTDHTYLPYRAGGRESSIHEMASLYGSMGHEITVVAKRADLPVRMYTRLQQGCRFQYWKPAYKVVQSDDFRGALEQLSKTGTIDAVVYNVDQPQSLFRELRTRFAKVEAMHLRDLVSVEDVNPASFPSDLLLVANSEYTANQYERALGRSLVVVKPRVSFERYAVQSTKQYVTFIGPVPEKGLETAIAVAAALPHLQFLFVESWPLGRQGRRELKRRLALYPNIRFLNRQLDMRTVYSRTRVMLTPSLWEEGFGRVVVEAQCSGIPCVASDRGALPETVGDAGRVMGHDEPIANWCAAVDAIATDDALYADLSAKALHQAKRHLASAVSEAVSFQRTLGNAAAINQMPEHSVVTDVVTTTIQTEHEQKRHRLSLTAKPVGEGSL